MDEYLPSPSIMQNNHLNDIIHKYRNVTLLGLTSHEVGDVNNR